VDDRKNILDKLIKQDAVKKIVDKRGSVSAFLYSSTNTNLDDDSRSLFLGFSNGSVVWVLFKDKRFESIDKSVVVREDGNGPKLTSVTALAYSPEDKILYVGSSGKSIENTIDPEPEEWIFLSQTWTTTTSTIGGDIKAYKIQDKPEETVFHRDRKAHQSSVLALMPLVFDNDNKFLIAVMGPQILPQTMYWGFSLEIPTSPGEVPTAYSESMSGGDVDDPSQHYPQVAFIDSGVGIRHSMAIDMIKDEWMGAQKCFAAGSSIEKAVFMGFKDGSLKIYDLNRKDWSDFLPPTQNSINTVQYSKIENNEYLIIGCEDGSIRCNTNFDKKWDILTEHAGEGLASALTQDGKQAVFTTLNKKYVLVNVGEGTNICYLTDGQFSEVPTHAVAIHRVDEDKTNVYVGYTEGQVWEYTYSKKENKCLGVKMLLDKQYINGPGPRSEGYSGTVAVDNIEISDDGKWAFVHFEDKVCNAKVYTPRSESESPWDFYHSEGGGNGIIGVDLQTKNVSVIAPNVVGSWIKEN
jgi:WD40 repeat protein